MSQLTHQQAMYKLAEFGVSQRALQGAARLTVEQLNNIVSSLEVMVLQREQSLLREYGFSLHNPRLPEPD